MTTHLDRPKHRCVMLEFEGKSFRLKDAAARIVLERNSCASNGLTRQRTIGRANTSMAKATLIRGENLLDLFLASSSQELKPPRNPAWFKQMICCTANQCRLTYISCTANIDEMPNNSFDLLENFVSELSEAASMSVLIKETEVSFDAEQKSAQLDARLRMLLPIGDAVELAIKVLKTGYPRDIRVAMRQLDFYKAAHTSLPVPLELCVVAQYLSPGARNELKRAGINYYDGTGSMYFKHRTYLIVKEREARHRPVRRPVKFFSGAREQVVHALLEHWLRADDAEEAYLSGAELAQQAQTSPYTVSLTMQEMEREGWVETSGKGPSQRRRVTDPAGILDAWAADWIARREPTIRWYAYAPKSNPTEMVLSHLADREGWALTGAAAANAVLHHLTQVDRVQVIVPPGQAEAWGQQLKLKQAEKGANIVFVERSGASLMFLEADAERPGSRFASRFIQYLDLLDGYGRNKELAAEYRNRVLKIQVNQ